MVIRPILIALAILAAALWLASGENDGRGRPDGAR